eukprot:jgi/Chlat1/9122/Chrsp97S08385
MEALWDGGLLPRDACLLLLAQLTAADRLRCEAVCRQWRAALNQCSWWQHVDLCKEDPLQLECQEADCLLTGKPCVREGVQTLCVVKVCQLSAHRIVRFARACPNLTKIVMDADSPIRVQAVLQLLRRSVPCLTDRVQVVALPHGHRLHSEGPMKMLSSSSWDNGIEVHEVVTT